MKARKKMKVPKTSEKMRAREVGKKMRARTKQRHEGTQTRKASKARVHVKHVRYEGSEARNLAHSD